MKSLVEMFDYRMPSESCRSNRSWSHLTAFEVSERGDTGIDLKMLMKHSSGDVGQMKAPFRTESWDCVKDTSLSQGHEREIPVEMLNYARKVGLPFCL